GRAPRRKRALLPVPRSGRASSARPRQRPAARAYLQRREPDLVQAAGARRSQDDACAAPAGWDQGVPRRHARQRVVRVLRRSRGQPGRAVRRHAVAHAAAVRGAIRYRGAGGRHPLRDGSDLPQASGLHAARRVAPRPGRAHGLTPIHMQIDKDVPMTTRDGVTLRADVYRPDAPGRHPVLLSRLPYDKNGRRRPGDIDVFVDHGYVTIIQDTRGRFASDGDAYVPLAYEANDGHDAVEWAAALPYSNGRVGTMGQSYLGATQYLLAPTRPPHLEASFPASAAADFHQAWVYHTGGAFELGWQIPYAIL